MTDYASIRATQEAAAALRDLSFDLTGRTRRRVSLSDAIEILCELASRHPEETEQITNERTP